MPSISIAKSASVRHRSKAPNLLVSVFISPSADIQVHRTEEKSMTQSVNPSDTRNEFQKLVANVPAKVPPHARPGQDIEVESVAAVGVKVVKPNRATD